MEFDRQEALEEIKSKLGFDKREDDEFTVKEIADCFGINASSVTAFLDREEVKYSRRKAMAEGRRQYVYRINVIIEK